MPRFALKSADARRNITVVTILLVAVVMALLYPFEISHWGRLGQALFDAAHALLMLFVTVILLKCMTRSCWKHVLTGLFLLIFLMECLQPLTGRSCSVGDAVYGVSGVLVGLLLFLPKEASKRRLSAFIAAFLIGVVVFWKPASILLDRWRMFRQFPVLCRFEYQGEIKRWKVNNCKMRLVRQYDGNTVAEVLVSENGTNLYPGIFMTDFPGDWSTTDALCFDLWTECNSEGVFECRVDDLAGNPPYHERFQTTLDLKPGWNKVTIPLHALRKTPSGRRMDISCIDKFGIFMTQMKSGAVFRLDNVELKMR